MGDQESVAEMAATLEVRQRDVRRQAGVAQLPTLAPTRPSRLEIPALAPEGAISGFAERIGLRPTSTAQRVMTRSLAEREPLAGLGGGALL